MNKRKIKKNQHYIPKCYLKRFTIKGEKSLLWAIEKKSAKFLKTTSSINNVCCEDYYYYQIDQENNVDHTTLEDTFSEIENISSQHIERICDSKVSSRCNIKEREQGELAFFIGLLLTRGPSFRDTINKLHGEIVTKTLKDLYNGDKLPKIPDCLDMLIKEKGIENVIKVQIHPFVSLEPMFIAAREIALTFLQKNWCFYKAKSNNLFITSDNPVSFNFSNRSIFGGPAHPLSSITVTLSKEVCLSIKPNASGPVTFSDSFNMKMFEATSSMINEINRLVICAADQYVYLSEKNENVRLHVSKYKNTCQKIDMETPNEKTYSIIKNPYLKSFKGS